MSEPKKNPVQVTDKHKVITKHMKSLAKVEARYKKGYISKKIFDAYKEYHLKKITSL